jgi:transposase
MEDVLDVYHRLYDPFFPVICFDESNKQCVGEVRTPIPCTPGSPLRVDDEYVRNGVGNILMAVEPLAGKRFVTVTESRTRVDFADFMKTLADDIYPNANKIVLVLDNLNTHDYGSFYEAFSPEEAHRLKDRFEIHYTPKHGSWLNMAEIELSVLKSQSLDRRIPDIETLRQEVLAWKMTETIELLRSTGNSQPKTLESD